MVLWPRQRRRPGWRAGRGQCAAGERQTSADAFYVVFFIASNVAETAFLRHKIFWALYVAAACHLAMRRRSA